MDDTPKKETKAPAAEVEIYMIHGYQPEWDEKKEPKPKKWQKGAFHFCAEKAASALVKDGHAKRVTDMSDKDLAKAGYGAEEADAENASE